MPDEMHEMLNAALTNDFERAKRLLASGLGISETIVLTDRSTDSHAQLEVTALHVAVMMSHVEVARFLLANGADVVARDGKGRTALELSEDAEIQKLLTKAAESRAHRQSNQQATDTYQERTTTMGFWNKLFGKKPKDEPVHCANCGKGVIMSWTCDTCGKIFCDVCSGLTKSQPTQHQGFTSQMLGGGTTACPLCEKK